MVQASADRVLEGIYWKTESDLYKNRNLESDSGYVEGN
jgi:hypothetical protein